MVLIVVMIMMLAESLVRSRNAPGFWDARASAFGADHAPLLSLMHRFDARITREVCEAARAYSIPVLYDVMGEVAACELRSAGREITSLDRTVGEDGDTTLGELVPDEDADDPEQVTASVLLRNAIRDILDDLDDRERGILELRYGLGGEEPCTLEEIGARLGVTRERIRQIEKKTLAKLRHPVHRRRLEGLTS